MTEVSGSRIGFIQPPSDLPSDNRPQPDWAVVHRELRRASVTRMLLWEEYCGHDFLWDSFSYSWFCERYTRNRPIKLPEAGSMRQVQSIAGETLFG